MEAKMPIKNNKIDFRLNEKDMDLFNKLMETTQSTNKSQLIRESIKTYEKVMVEAPELIVSETVETQKKD